MKKQIDEILMVIDDNACANISEDECDSKDSCAICRAERIYNAGYRKQSEVIDEFAERIKKNLPPTHIR